MVYKTPGISTSQEVRAQLIHRSSWKRDCLKSRLAAAGECEFWYRTTEVPLCFIHQLVRPSARDLTRFHTVSE